MYVHNLITEDLVNDAGCRDFQSVVQEEFGDPLASGMCSEAREFGSHTFSFLGDTCDLSCSRAFTLSGASATFVCDPMSERQWQGTATCEPREYL